MGRTISCGAVPNPCLVIDGPAVLYRAFFALPDSITDDDGHPVNALLGSVNQVLWCVEKYDPRAVVWCFGAEAGEYRVEAYPRLPRRPPADARPARVAVGARAALYEALGWSVIAHAGPRGRRPAALARRGRDRGRRRGR